MSETFGTPLTDIPNWLLMQISQPTGRRMPPLKKWHDGLTYHRPLSRDQRGNYVPFPYVAPAPEVGAAGPKSYKTMGLGGWKTGNLLENEYPYWTGEKEALGTWARCRWCGEGQVASTPESRTAHQEADHCTKNLRIVYRLSLAPRRRCIICGTDSQRARWGMALCSIECDNGFRFKLLLSNQMQILRRLARERKLLYPMISTEREAISGRLT
jgi:hypothetical protein